VNKNRIFSNAAVSVLQVVVTSCTLFFLYRILLSTIGIKLLGVWSVVMATSSLTQIANPGFGASTTKFVSQYLARGEKETAGRVIETAVLSLSLLMALLLAAVYPIVRMALPAFIAPDCLSAGLSILPYAFLTLWISFISGVLQAGLDGFQRIDSKNMVIITGSLFYVVSCAFFARFWGLVGVAFASVLQALWILVFTWIILKRRLPCLPALCYGWDRSLFREMLRYGLGFQFITVTGMLSDPLTKIMLSRFGTLSEVAYYEMANRMVQQVRGVLATPGYLLVPAIADLRERGEQGKIGRLYDDSYQLIFSLSAAAYTLLLVYLPVISQLWIGQVQASFMVFSALLCLGWFCNLLAIPSYYANLGTGELRWNLIGHVLVAVMNPVLSFLLGWRFGAVGVVAGWVGSIAAGNLLILCSYHQRNHIRFVKLFPRSAGATSAICVLSLVAGYAVLPGGSGPWGGGGPARWTLYLVVSCAIGAALWRLPVRQQLAAMLAVKKQRCCQE